MTPTRIWFLALVAALGGFLSGFDAIGAAGTDWQRREAAFRGIPAEARPHVWWHWVDGCISRAGIDADLDAMASSGIGGACIFFVGTRHGFMRGPVDFFSDEWFDLFRYAVAGAKARGLEISTHNCPGWSSSGGPWNRIEDSMKKLAVSRTSVRGPCAWRGKLPTPSEGWYRDLAVTAFPTPASATDAVPADRLVNLTDRMAPDGTLAWDVPAGAWTVQRTGYRATGDRNHPGQTGGEGLECDKLSRRAVEAHWNGYMGRLLSALGPELSGATGGLTEVLLDSYEIGGQDWTDGLEDEFARRRGYRLERYWPVLADAVVGSPEETARFRRDFRLTLSELWTENYAYGLKRLANAAGLRFACEGYGTAPCDVLSYTGAGDVAMCEFWSVDSVSPAGPFAASAARLHGRSFVGAEAFTSSPDSDGWRVSPKSVKHLSDFAMCDGVNRLYYHTWVHQPWTSPRMRPGLTLGPWGMHFNRNQTWWPYVQPFLAYQTRCQYLLRQGRYVSDVGVFVGDRVSDRPWQERYPRPEIPGFLWDYCDADSIEAAHVEGGDLITPHGRFKVLMLPDAADMSATCHSNVAALVRAGARAVSETDDVKKALSEADVPADVNWKSEPSLVLRWTHRRTDGADVYFVARHGAGTVTVPVTFRVDGRLPELWNAQDGSVCRAATWSHPSRGLTCVDLPFAGDDAWFVVFRRPEDAVDAPPPMRTERVVASEELTGRWEASFADEEVEDPVVFETLTSWTSSSTDAVRYYAGTAIYRRQMPVRHKSDERVILDLGDVRDFAEVTVNGRTFPCLYRAPYRLDITDAVGDGKASATLEVKVANLWVNRLIGDERLPADVTWEKEWWPFWAPKTRPSKWGVPLARWPDWLADPARRTSGRRTFATWRVWTGDSPLLPSGLLGPVRVERVSGEKS